MILRINDETEVVIDWAEQSATVRSVQKAEAVTFEVSGGGEWADLYDSFRMGDTVVQSWVNEPTKADSYTVSSGEPKAKDPVYVWEEDDEGDYQLIVNGEMASPLMHYWYVDSYPGGAQPVCGHVGPWRLAECDSVDEAKAALIEAWEKQCDQ